MGANNSTDDDLIFELRDMNVTFDMDRGQAQVLRNVSFDVSRGEILGVVGESGSGKSMFASALLDAVEDPGLLTGDVLYHSDPDTTVNITQLSKNKLKRIRWEEISMVFQGAMSSFNPTMTIQGHFEETLKAHEMDISDGMATAHELLSDLYLDGERILGSYPHELSGGMKQRTLIALSLLLEPNMLVLDEPTAALDLLMQRSILQLLRDVKDKYEITFVFITHDLPLVAEFIDRLAIMYAFEFVEKGPVAEVLSNPAHPYTQALLEATPNLSMSTDEMNAVEGSSPDPVNIPTGCSYHPRCPLADENCKQFDPAFHDVSDTHSAACFYWDQAMARDSLGDEVPQQEVTEE